MRVGVLCLLLLAFGSIRAAGRANPNPQGRLVLDPARPIVRTSERLSSTAVTRTVVAVGLPAGAVAIDSTWYDLQDMGSFGHHIEVGPDGRVHLTWQDEFCELA